MRVIIAGSGSRGNATLFDGGGTQLLVDAGLSLRAVRQRVEGLVGERPRIGAILITHSHSDHVQHLGAMARQLRVPVYMTASTERQVKPEKNVDLRIFPSRSKLRIGALEVSTAPVPHDAAQVAVRVGHRRESVALVTDLGHVPKSLVRFLRGCRTLLMESNHCPELLATAPYPAFVKARIAGTRGHLSNAQAAELLKTLAPSLERVVLMHLSQKANSPRRAHRIAKRALAGHTVQLTLAKQDHPTLIQGAVQNQLGLGF